MLIITAKNDTPFFHRKDKYDTHGKIYGPVLRKELLHEVQIFVLPLLLVWLIYLYNPANIEVLGSGLSSVNVLMCAL